MDERLAAPTIYCSRCNAEYPPQAEAFITCRTCGMSINTRAAPTEARSRPPTGAPPMTLVGVTVGGVFYGDELVGPGTCEVTAHALVLRGFQPRGALWRVSVGVVALLLAAVAWWFMSEAGVDDTYAYALPITFVIAAVVRPNPASGRPARRAVPLEDVKEAYLARGKPGAVLRLGEYGDEVRIVTQDPAGLCSRILAARASKVDTE